MADLGDPAREHARPRVRDDSVLSPHYWDLLGYEPGAVRAGRDFFLPGPQAATAWTQPGGSADNAVEHVIAGANLEVAWRRDIGAGSSRVHQVMAPVVADNGRVFVLDGPGDRSRLVVDVAHRW